MDIIAFTAALGTALTGSPHCTGMCGAFAAAAGGVSPSCGANRIPGTRALAAHALYQIGKTTSYLFIGVLASSLGATLSQAGSGAARGLSLVAGLFLMAVGASALGLLPRLRFDESSAARKFATAAWSRAGSGLLSLRSPLVPLYLGLFSGLLPCPLVYAFAARASAAPSILDAAATMIALGLGTLPVLLALSLTGSALSPLLRSRLVAVSGALLILLGAWTIARGWAAPPCCAG